MNIYKYLFYILYKFVKLTTKEELQNQVLPSAFSAYLICLTNNYAAILLFSKAAKYLPSNLMATIILFSVVPVIIYFINKKIFIEDDKYKDIEAHYDKNNKITKSGFIIISTLYCLLSIGLMILAGKYYGKK